MKLEREGFGEKRSGTADASQRLRYVGEGEACDPVFAEATTGTRDPSFASGYGGQAGQATLGVIRLGGWKPPPRVGRRWAWVREGPWRGEEWNRRRLAEAPLRGGGGGMRPSLR